MSKPDWADIFAKTFDSRYLDRAIGADAYRKAIARALRAAYRRGQRDEREACARCVEQDAEEATTAASHGLLFRVAKLVRARGATSRSAREGGGVT